MSASQETAAPFALFPLPPDILTEYLTVCEGLTPLEMDFIAGSNLQLGDPTDPAMHVMLLKEHPYMDASHYVSRQEALTPDMIGRVSDLAQLNSIWEPARRRVRIGACIAGTVLRRHVETLQNQGLQVPSLMVDPGRRYLRLPESPTAAEIKYYWGQALIGGRTEYHLGNSLMHGYLAAVQSVDDIRALHRVWQRSAMSELVGNGKDKDEDAFGEVCSAIAATWRICCTLVREEQLAPLADTVFDKARHIRLDPQAEGVPEEPWMRHYRRPVSGFSIESSNGTEQTFWGTELPNGARPLAVHTALARYVRQDDKNSDAYVKVAVKASVEAQVLGPEAVLMVQDVGFGPLRADEKVKSVNGEHVNALFLCRNGRALQLTETLPNSPDDLDMGMLWALVMVLQQQDGTSWNEITRPVAQPSEPI